MIDLDDVYKLKDIFMSDTEYNALDGDNLYNELYTSNFSQARNYIKEWELLTEAKKDKYIYTLVKNVSNVADTHKSYNLLKAILFARHSSIEELENFTKDVLILGANIDEGTLDKRYRLLLISKIVERLSNDIEYCKSSQIINVNPHMHSKEYYKQLIDDIFKNTKLPFSMKDTSIFKTIGDRTAFALFLDDMITNHQSRTNIANSTGIDLKQIAREKKFLDHYIGIFQN